MNSLYDQTAEFLRKASELGLVDEINERIEEKNNARRAELIAEMKALPTAEQAGLPQFAKIATQAMARLEKAKTELAEAQAAYHQASMRCYGENLAFEGRRNLLEREIRPLTPEFIKEAYIDLDYLYEHVRHITRTWISYEWGWLGRVPKEESNLEKIDTLTADIKAAMRRLDEMIFEAVDLEKMRHEVAALCEPLQKRSFDLGVDQNEFNNRYAPRNKVAAAETAQAKRASERRRQLSSITV